MENLAYELKQNAPLLAQQTIDFLKPHLLTAAGTLVDQSLAKAGAGVAGVFAWLKSKFTHPVDKAVLDEAIKSPAQDRNWRGLHHQLVELLHADPVLQKELAALLPSPPPGTSIIQTLNNSGNQNTNVQISGKANTTKIGR